MTGKLNDAIQDGYFAGAMVKRSGVIVIAVLLAVAVVVMAISNVWVQYNTAKLVSDLTPKMLDRWTGADMDAYKIEHAKEVAAIVAKEKAEQAKTNKLLLEAIQAIREHLARQDSKTDTRLENIEETLSRIEKKVFNGYNRGGGG